MTNYDIMSSPKQPRHKKFRMRLQSGAVTVYAGPKVISALEEVTTNMDLYHGVKLWQVLEAVYETGLKNGRREVIEELDRIKGQVKYLPPGRPRKRRKRN